ncbi:hypothetical protein NFI96_003224 [Prochilodus magdalenae]|nr:hypothetical protein NFI96_003224 [Prochilodus magdalenae]
MQELQVALQSMANGKAPGIDGLPAEFYKAFWDVVGEDLLAMLNDSLVGGHLPLSCRRAVLTLLPKKGDLSEAKNWRPVSLLCADYKVLSKVLANRLKEVMGQVTHADQAYCVPGRSILDNISLVRDVLEVAGLECPFGLISLDQEKAFDRVEHQYLWDTFGAFGFSPRFVSMVRVLYCNIESVLKVNAIEPMLHRLRQELSGVQLAEDIPRFYVAAYADDVVVGVTGGEDITVLNNIIREFEVVSSAKEPVIHGARLSLLEDGHRSLSERCRRVTLVTVRHLVETAGVNLDQAGALAQKLGLRSTRVVMRMLQRVRQAMAEEDRRLLQGWTLNCTALEREGPFPCLWVSPTLTVDDTGSPLLSLEGLLDLRFDCVNAKVMYRGCVKILNQTTLLGQVDTPWRAFLGLATEMKPAWRALYKPPLTKSAGDMQWRVLHGIIAVNAFVSILNPAVSSECPFCSLRETVFHCFTQCSRLDGLFRVLTSLFNAFDERFDLQVFIFGFPYRQKRRKKCQLINFITGQAKMPIYLSRKKRLDSGLDCDVCQVFKGLVKSRIKVEYSFYSTRRDYEGFRAVWDYDGVLCTVDGGVLTFWTGRRQMLKMGGITSSSLTLSTGAPQGCVLSPLLYSLYTHDCTARHSSNVIIKSADDTTAVGLISNNNEEAYREEVSFLTHWSRENNLSLNVNRTKELIVDFRKQERVHTPITITGAAVERVSSFKPLGVHITEELTWTEHTTRVVKKSQQRLFFLRRLKRFPQNILLYCTCAVESILTGSISTQT